MYMFIVYSLSCKTRLLESKGNSLQKLLSPLMPVSLLLQLSDLVFASDAVIGGIICIMGVFLMTLWSSGRIDVPVLQLHAEDDRSFVTLLISDFQAQASKKLVEAWIIFQMLMMTMARVIPLDLAMNLHMAAVDAGKTNIKMQVWQLCMWTIVCLCY